MDDLFSDCPPLLRDFLFYMQTIRSCSQRTVEAYHGELRLFLRYLSQSRGKNTDTPFSEIDITGMPSSEICSVNISDVYGYLAYATSGRKNAPATRARKVSSLRSFYKYITTKTILLTENPLRDLEMPSLRRSLPRYLTLEESLDLLVNLPEDSEHYARDYCILTLFLNCGMRLSELCGINLNDIRDNTLRLLGKGNKERMIYLNDACQSAIAQYLATRKPPKKQQHREALLLSRNGTRLTPRRVEQIVAQCLKTSDLDGKGYSPHKLRHTAATLMYQHGNVDIRALKEILGHANLSTTELYTHISDKQIEKALKSSPLSRVKPKKPSKKEPDDESQQ